MGQVAQALTAANIQPIFAVTGATLPVYQVSKDLLIRPGSFLSPRLQPSLCFPHNSFRPLGPHSPKALFLLSPLFVTQELSQLIPKSAVGELREDSSNVVQLIMDAYDVSGEWGSGRGEGEVLRWWSITKSA